MKFRCNNPECKREFMYAAKKTVGVGENGEEAALFTSIGHGLMIADRKLETHVCPFCLKKDFDELLPEAKPEQRVVAVWVHDLTTKEQTDLNGLLQQGYEVVGRYAKQYILEKREEVGESKSEG